MGSVAGSATGEDVDTRECEDIWRKGREHMVMAQLRANEGWATGGWVSMGTGRGARDGLS